MECRRTVVDYGEPALAALVGGWFSVCGFRFVFVGVLLTVCFCRSVVFGVLLMVCDCRFALAGVRLPVVAVGGSQLWGSNEVD